jgi:hypothetical protein
VEAVLRKWLSGFFTGSREVKRQDILRKNPPRGAKKAVFLPFFDNQNDLAPQNHIRKLLLFIYFLPVILGR